MNHISSDFGPNLQEQGSPCGTGCLKLAEAFALVVQLEAEIRRDAWGQHGNFRKWFMAANGIGG